MRRNVVLCGAMIAGLCGIAVPSARGQAAGPQTRVLVLPFVAPSDAASQWMGKGVQQDLFTDLTQGTTAHVLAPAGVGAANDADGAVRAAREAGASIVVFGQAQASTKEVRLTGEVVDTATGRPLAAIKATGPADQLFHLEDALAGQVFASLPKTLLTAQALQGLQHAQQNPSGQPAQQAQEENTYSQTPAAPRASASQVPLDSAPATPPVIVDGPDVDVVEPPVAAYPSYSYDYGAAPVYEYAPAYSYFSPGCDVWPEISAGLYLGGGYGCYFGDGGFADFGYGHYGYGHYGEHGWGDHHGGDFHHEGGFSGHGLHGGYVGAGGHALAGGGGGHGFVGGYAGGQFSGSHYAQPHGTFLHAGAQPGPAFHGGSGSIGAGHVFSGASRGFSHAFSGGSGGGSHSSRGGAFHGGGGFHGEGGSGSHGGGHR